MTGASLEPPVGQSVVKSDALRVVGNSWLLDTKTKN
jgi:hypothetical protein